MNATVTFPNQTTNGTVIHIANATLPENGFIVIINNCSRCHPLITSVRGSSPYLEQGHYAENISIPLDSSLKHNQILRAVLLADTNGDQDPDYDGSDEVITNDTNASISDHAHIVISNATETESPRTTSEHPVRTEPGTTDESSTPPPNSSTAHSSRR